jgi:hypothetical protein
MEEAMNISNAQSLRLSRTPISRFCLGVYSKLKDILLEKRVQVGLVLDIGFVRFDKGELNSIYLIVTYKDLRMGLAKFDYKNGDWVFNSFYVTIDDVREIRFNEKGEILYEYIYMMLGTTVCCSKYKNNVVVETTYMRLEDVKEFPEEAAFLQKNNIVEGGSTFKYCTKDNGNILYLSVK